MPLPLIGAAMSMIPSMGGAGGGASSPSSATTGPVSVGGHTINVGGPQMSDTKMAMIAAVVVVVAVIALKRRK